MQKIFQILLITILPIGLLSFTISEKDFSKNGKEEIEWISWEEAVKANEKNPKPLMVDLYTHWCGYCKKMDRTTFKDKDVVKYLNENFYPVKFNAEQKENITWNGMTFKFVKNGRRGFHELAASLTDNRLSYPTYVYLTPEFQRVMISPGYKGANDFLPELIFANEKKYLETNWKKFKKEYDEKQKAKP